MVVQHDLELVFPEAKVPRPILCEMVRSHDVVFNIASACVSHHRGHFRLIVLGEEANVLDAEAWLREQGLEVGVVRSMAYHGEVPHRPQRRKAAANEAVVSKKLWLTFVDERRFQPLIWDMGCRYDVTYDIRQSSIGETVGIMALLLEGPASHVAAGIGFLRERGVEVEPIEKSIIEG